MATPSIEELGREKNAVEERFVERSDINATPKPVWRSLV